jgi:serine phosphatase RsbU (regulator of sigma subunit)
MAAENIIAEIRHILQDILVPDFKALTVRVEGMQKQAELSEKSMGAQFDAMRAEMAAFRAELGAFRAEIRSEFQAQRSLLQNEVLRETGPIRERLATLEARGAVS